MKIYPVYTAPINPLSSSQPSTTSSAPSVSPESHADTVSFSYVSKLVAQAMVQPEVRADKVEAIRSKVTSGTYKVDPQKTAEAVISSLLSGDR